MKRTGDIISLPDGKPAEQFVETGVTAEGYTYVLRLNYELNAPDGAYPLRITGSYGAKDGGGEVVITKTDSGQFISYDCPDKPQPRPYDCLPWVIADGEPD